MMRCKNCGNLRKRLEDFYNVSLEVKNQKSVYDGLRQFVSGEIISDYQCEACNQKVDLEKKATIDKLPNTLIVHLQRIVFDFDTLRQVKLNDRVEFPNVLNLKEFTTAEVLQKDKKAATQEKRRSKLPKRQPGPRAEDTKEDHAEGLNAASQHDGAADLLIDEEAQLSDADEEAQEIEDIE